MDAGSVHVIGCGVLAADLEVVAARDGLTVTSTFLPAGLHARPNELRVRVQEAIDEISGRPGVDRIALAYGVCGRGTVGICARRMPVAIPRVHDCIALFLGSDEEYRRQFQACSGTYYVSAGWVQARDGEGASSGPQTGTCDDPEYPELVTRYGAENADVIQQFLGSWKGNYRRAAYIDTGIGGNQKRYERVARQMAEDFGWTFERLSGTHALLHELLSAETTSEQILVVPPGHVTRFDALHRRMEAGEPRPDAPSGASGLQRVFSETVSVARDGASSVGQAARVGIGIDAGGTFTDAVLFDLDSQKLLAKTKAPTTHWDYSIGIREALSRWSSAELSRAQFVSLSTTLATNAIVEGRGQPVGLFVMPPYGLFEEGRFLHRPIAPLTAQLDIDGSELAPLDPEELLNKAREMVAHDGVRAFAVGGYASHANPAHEVAAAALLHDTFGLPVSCGHELSEGLNYRVRAETAALNAGILPCIEQLLSRMELVLGELGVEAPVYVVCSDGGLMGLAAARRHPLLTMLSGPAASVAGAGYLGGEDDAVVADMGGTTTDLALVHGGRAALRDEGAAVGQWQTHVRALDLRTVGLGGDSAIRIAERHLQVGPDRVAAVSSLMQRDSRMFQAVEWLASSPDTIGSGGAGAQLIWLCGEVPRDRSADEQRLVAFLQGRPRSVPELTRLMGKADSRFLPLEHLLADRVIAFAGLTPTDVLHAQGRLDVWPRAAAVLLCDAYATTLGLSREGFCDAVMARLREALAEEVLLRCIPGMAERASLPGGLREALFGRSQGVASLRGCVDVPLVAIGAPAHCYLPEVSRHLDVRVIVPEHAEVANAVGAVVSRIAIAQRVTVATDEDGRYRIDGAPGDVRFASVDDATNAARQFVLERVLARADECGATLAGDVEVTISDHNAPTSDGGMCFVARHVEAHVQSAPVTG